jgi:hypothetical protein
VQPDHEQHRRPDRDQHVGDARDAEQERPLLDPEERRQLLVVHLRPQADERGAHEPGVVAEAQAVRDRGRKEAADHEAGGRHRHREPERRADDERPPLGIVRVEVEAEEGARDPELKNDHEHRRQRDDRLDLPESARAEVMRVEREQEHGEDPRDDPAEPVDRGVSAEAPHLRRERAHRSRE